MFTVSDLPLARFGDRREKCREGQRGETTGEIREKWEGRGMMGRGEDSSNTGTLFPLQALMETITNGNSQTSERFEGVFI